MPLVQRLKRRLRPAPSPPRSAPPRPGRPQYLFVVTYGRSGSTLIQALLNTLPRTVIRGENSLFVLPLYRAMAQTLSFRESRVNSPRAKASSSAFYGIRQVRRGHFVRATRTLVTQALLGPLHRGDVDVLGFKEVRWHQVEPEETEGFFAFLDSAFPGCRFVLNQRDHDQVANSGFWQQHDSQEVFASLKRAEEIQDYLRRTRPARCLDTRYELITSSDRAVSDQQLRELAEFVTGSSDAALIAELRTVLGVGHGPNPFGKSRGRRQRQQAESDSGR